MTIVLKEVDRQEGGNGSATDPKMLLKAAVQFAFKVHQYVGGFNAECNEVLTKVEQAFAARSETGIESS